MEHYSTQHKHNFLTRPNFRLEYTNAKSSFSSRHHFYDMTIRATHFAFIPCSLGYDLSEE